MDDRRFYVYEWFLTDGRVFYVGKGTGKRYNHILVEIEKGIKHGYYYKKLQEDFGIDYRIVKDKLLEEEALELENDLINQRRFEGNYLIQFMFDLNENDIRNHQAELERAKKYAERCFTPCVRVDSFHKFYYGITDFDITFDTVSNELLSKPYTSYARGLLDNHSSQKVEEEKIFIENYIITTGGSIKKSFHAASAIIIYNDLDYVQYLYFKENNIPVIHSFDVIKYINEHNYQIAAPCVNVSFPNDQTHFKLLMQQKPATYPYMVTLEAKNFDPNDNYVVYKRGMECEKENPFLAIWYYEASLLTSNPWYYYPCFRLAILYSKYKLYNELHRILILACDNVERDKSYFTTKLLQLKKKFSSK